MTNFRMVFLTLLVLLGCACAPKPEGAPLDWLAGDWVNRDGNITEHWQVVSTDTLEGSGVTTSTDKISTEYMRLVRMGGEIFFIAKVSHNDLAIAFRLTAESTAERAVFSNPAHDFPKQIVYQKNGPDRMTVIVSDGGTEGFELNFARR